MWFNKLMQAIPFVLTLIAAVVGAIIDTLAEREPVSTQ